MLFEQIDDFDTQLKTRIMENIFEILPDDGISMVIFDNAGRTIANDNKASSDIFKNKSVFKRIIQMLDDGCGSIISTVAGKQMLAFELARWQDTQLYTAIVFQNLSPNDSSGLDDILELTMNQFVSLAQCHIENPQRKETLASHSTARFIYN